MQFDKELGCVSYLLYPQVPEASKSFLSLFCQSCLFGAYLSTLPQGDSAPSIPFSYNLFSLTPYDMLARCVCVGEAFCKSMI
jgi:hypothetical protein